MSKVKVKMPALPIPAMLPCYAWPTGLYTEAQLWAAQLAAAEAMREACIEAALPALGYKHLASENAEIYAAQDHALNLAVRAIRALEVEQS